MRRKLLLLVACLACGVTTQLSANPEDDYSTAPIPTPPFPAPYKNDVVYPQSLSPDKQYGFIYPARSVVFDLPRDEVKTCLVTPKPFHVVTEMPDFDGYLAISSGGSLTANWAKDSSAVVVIDGSRWGPAKVYLVPLHEGKAGRIIDLTAEVSKLVQPDYDKVKPEPFNDHFNFLFDDANHVTVDDHDQLIRDRGWTFNNLNQVIIDCTCASNPKHIAGIKSWEGTVKGLWDIAQGKFVQQKFKRTFNGEYKDE